MSKDVNIRIKTTADTAGIDKAEKGLGGISASARKAEAPLRAVGSLTYRGLAATIAGVETALWGVRLAVDTVKGSLLSTLDIAGRMETLQLSLDVMSGGDGETLFNQLDLWAAKMPVNTEKAIESYKLLRAMGIEPTIDQMTTLVDTSVALGGSEQTLESIARALGQIQTKGKVSMEEVMQLAEAGVPVFDILRTKLGLTADDFENMGKAGITSGQVINAVLEGLTENYGGMSERMQTTWDGITQAAEDSADRTKRAWADAGLMDTAKAAVMAFTATLDDVRNNDSFEQWAEDSTAAIADTFKSAIRGGASVLDWVSSNADIIENGLLGYMLYGKKGAIVLAGLQTAGLDVFGIIKRQTKAADAINRGFITKSQWALSNDKELEALLNKSGYNSAPKYTGEAGKLDTEIRKLETYKAKMQEVAKMPYNKRLIGGYGLSDKETREPQKVITETDAKITSLKNRLKTELSKVPDTFTGAANKYLANFDKALGSLKTAPASSGSGKSKTKPAASANGGDSKEAEKIATEIARIKEDTAQNIHELSTIGMSDFDAQRADALYAYQSESAAIRGTTKDTEAYRAALTDRYDSEIVKISELEKAYNAEEAKKTAEQIAAINAETAQNIASLALIGADEYQTQSAAALSAMQAESEAIKGTAADTDEYRRAIEERYDSEIEKIKALKSAREGLQSAEQAERNAYSVQHVQREQTLTGATSLSAAYIQNDFEYQDNLKIMSPEDAGYIRDTANATAELKESLDTLHGAFTALESPMADFFSTFAQTGKLDWSGLANGMLQSLQIYAAQKTAHLLMESAYEYALGFGKSLNPLTAAQAPAHYAAAGNYAANAAVMGSFVVGSGLAGMAHDGLDRIPQTGTYLLEQNERIVGSRLNGDLVGFMDNVNSFVASAGGGNTFNVYAHDAESFENSSAVRKLEDTIIRSDRVRRALGVK